MFSKGYFIANSAPRHFQQATVSTQQGRYSGKSVSTEASPSIGTAPETNLPPFEHLSIGRDLSRELRSDHAGEAGAVAIYKGILAVTRSDEVRNFATRHLQTERRHLRFFDDFLPDRLRSRLLPVWRAAGWTLGAVAALAGPRGVYRTIAAVEAFVETHYGQQISKMGATPELAPLRSILRGFCDEEVEHHDDAAGRLPQPPDKLASLWMRFVGFSSALGVVVARRI
jgi:ubiquinone biosynthesis monooxygenase Coq7